jgi:hypothetical protein
MFVEVRYAVAKDEDRLSMYEDMERREVEGEKVVCMAPFELGERILLRHRVEVMIVLYRKG